MGHAAVAGRVEAVTITRCLPLCRNILQTPGVVDHISLGVVDHSSLGVVDLTTAFLVLYIDHSFLMRTYLSCYNPYLGQCAQS